MALPSFAPLESQLHQHVIFIVQSIRTAVLHFYVPGLAHEGHLPCVERRHTASLPANNPSSGEPLDRTELGRQDPNTLTSCTVMLSLKRGDLSVRIQPVSQREKNPLLQ